ncbi:hypothetical protein [Rhodoferax sp.]|uniref:hypothetical protein n=1 Tax=Rhodoferax sp. TaxID=50421 RepID=UPI00284A6AEE|nr:hypothetical protein [Rhodoferax sp.]MDR3370060.1 hypothetical protein [Rhodoferax sp.]
MTSLVLWPFWGVGLVRVAAEVSAVRNIFEMKLQIIEPVFQNACWMIHYREHLVVTFVQFFGHRLVFKPQEDCNGAFF